MPGGSAGRRGVLRRAPPLPFSCPGGGAALALGGGARYVRASKG